MSHLRKLWRKIAPNPLDQMLKRGDKKILIGWNRGLGDIPLGLFALVHRIHQLIPDAEITFVTRKDLEEGFAMLPGVKVVTADWKRGEKYTLPEHEGLSIPYPDPTYWCKWQLGTLVPKLHWPTEWEDLWKKFGLKGEYVGLHVHSETSYGYEKNWPEEKWKDLIATLVKEGKQVLLFGVNPGKKIEGVVDLRGKTTLCELLSIIKHSCTHIVAPDSGILSIFYFLDINRPIKVVSLWADPNQGLLKQAVNSPNPRLQHVSLVGENENIATITVERVKEALDA